MTWPNILWCHGTFYEADKLFAYANRENGRYPFFAVVAPMQPMRRVFEHVRIPKPLRILGQRCRHPIHFNAPIWSTNICFSINIIFIWVNKFRFSTNVRFLPAAAFANSGPIEQIKHRMLRYSAVARVSVEMEKRHLLSPRRKYLWAVENIAVRENTIVQFCPRLANSETPRFVTVRACCIPKSVWWQCNLWISWGRRTNLAAGLLSLCPCFGRSCGVQEREKDIYSWTIFHNKY